MTERPLVVLSPHQNNLDLRPRMEIRDRPPPDDSNDWEEIVEGSFTVRNSVRACAEFDQVPVVRIDLPAVKTFLAGLAARGDATPNSPGASSRL